MLPSKIIYTRSTTIFPPFVKAFQAFPHLPSLPLVRSLRCCVVVSNVLSEVSLDSRRERAEGECRGKSATTERTEEERKRKTKGEQQGETATIVRQRERDGGERGQKETRTSLSGRLYVEVGRERASRRLVERGCLSLIKISRNSSARPRKFAAAIHPLASFASTCVFLSLFLSFPLPPVALFVALSG